jgi:hypothetical protein
VQLLYAERIEEQLLQPGAGARGSIFLQGHAVLLRFATAA